MLMPYIEILTISTKHKRNKVPVLSCLFSLPGIYASYIILIIIKKQIYICALYNLYSWILVNQLISIQI